MKKLLLFFVSLATLLWLLTSCDSFKKNEVNPAPTTEVVNQAVVDLVKLYYPNATDIIIKEIVKDRVWSARFFVGDKEVILDFDNNNKIIKTTIGYRIASLVLDVPDKIISYIKSNHTSGTIYGFSVLLDRNENITHYIGLVSGLFDTQWGKRIEVKEMKFDVEGNYVGLYEARDFGGVLGSPNATMEFRKSLDELPVAVQQFIKDKGIDKYKLATNFATQSYSEPSYVITEDRYTKSSLFVIRTYKPLERDAKTNKQLSIANDIFLKSDGTLLEWQGYRPNSTRGQGTEVITENMILAPMKQGFDKLLGVNNWRMVYGLQTNSWFTVQERKFKIEDKSESDPSIYYDYTTSPAFDEGDWNPNRTSISKVKDIKKQEELVGSVVTMLNQKLPNWKFISGTRTLSSVMISSAEKERLRESYFLIVESNGKKYKFQLDVNEPQFVMVWEY